VIEKHPVKVVMVNQRCDACKTGYMTPTGITLPSYPPKYEHRCNNCKATTTYESTYPHTEYEYITEILA